MNMIIRLALLGWLSCFFFLSSESQILESNSVGERNYAFQVKHLEEFFERFNAIKTTYLNEYIKSHYPGITVNRTSLIRGLFNRENKSRDSAQVNAFINTVTDSAAPIFLDFYSGQWVAEAHCKFKYLGKLINVNLILKIEGNEKEGSKWLLESARAAEMAEENDSMSSATIAKSRNFINPLSHITYFSGLYKAFNDRKHIYDYLDSGFLDHSSSRKFLNAYLKKKISYQYVKDITFHFLQIDGWIFTVNQFERETVNSGWLISTIRRVNDAEKFEYMEKLLE